LGGHSKAKRESSMVKNGSQTPQKPIRGISKEGQSQMCQISKQSLVKTKNSEPSQKFFWKFKSARKPALRPSTREKEKCSENLSAASKRNESSKSQRFKKLQNLKLHPGGVQRHQDLADSINKNLLPKSTNGQAPKTNRILFSSLDTIVKLQKEPNAKRRDSKTPGSQPMTLKAKID
jgi:hypothetical protein